MVYHATVSPDRRFMKKMTDGTERDRVTCGTKRRRSDIWDRERQGDALTHGTRRYGRNMVNLQCSWGACYSIDKEDN